MQAEWFNPGSLADLIARHGYWALFVGTFLEGETILIIAGYLAQGGRLDLPLVVFAAFLGSFLGDQTFFFIGRRRGLAFLEKRPAWRRKAERAFALLARHQAAVILGFRFLYGVRNVTPFVIGASGLSPWRFFVLNFLGALAWAAAFGSIGYSLGSLAEEVFERVGRYEEAALGGLFLLALAYLARSAWRKN